MDDYYATLGVDREASPEDIKKAFRNLSKEHHPDHGGDEDKFKEINEAYSVLSNPEKRAAYDNPMMDFGPFGGFGSNPFSPFQRRRPNPNAPRRGRNIRLEHEAPMHMFIFGGELKIKFNVDDACDECRGQGATEFNGCSHCGGTGMVTTTQTARGVHIQSTAPCTECKGRGRTPKNSCEFCDGTGTINIDRKIVLPIPAGFRDGQAAGAAGQGGKGFNGGPPGDLIVKLHMKYPDLDELTDEQRELLEEL